MSEENASKPFMRKVRDARRNGNGSHLKIFKYVFFIIIKSSELKNIF